MGMHMNNQMISAEDQRFSELCKKVSDNTATPEELQEVSSLLNRSITAAQEAVKKAME